MQVFGFDLVAYPEHFDHLKVNGELPYPLPKQYFRPALAVRNYREHLEAWALMEELGFDGVGFNEHHTSPYGWADENQPYLSKIPIGGVCCFCSGEQPLKSVIFSIV